MARDLQIDRMLGEIEMASTALRIVLDDNEATVSGMIESEAVKDKLIEYVTTQNFLNRIIARCVAALEEVTWDE